MFYENFERLCRRSDISPSAAGIKCGFSKSTASAWKKNGSIPKEADLIKLADLLGCDVHDFFLSPEQAMASDYMRDNMSMDGIVEFHDREGARHGGSTVMELTPVECYLVSVYRMGGSDWKNRIYEAVERLKLEMIAEHGGIAAIEEHYKVEE